MTKKVVAALLLAALVLGCCGLLAGCGRKAYSKAQAEAMMTEYIEEKYGDTPQLERVEWVQKRSSNGEYIASQGYCAKTVEGYYIRMNVFDDVKAATFRDTREYPQIEEALQALFADNPVSGMYRAQLPSIQEGNSEALWDSLRHAFTQKWDGDIVSFLSYQPALQYVFTLENSKPLLQLRLRAENPWSFGYKDLPEYVKEKAELLGCIVKAAIVSPFVSDEQLEWLDFDEIYESRNPGFVYDYVQAGPAGEDVPRHNVGRRMQQDEDVDGLDVAEIWMESGGGAISGKDVQTVEAPATVRLLQHGGAAYEVMSDVYALDTGERELVGDVVLELDTDRLLPDFWQENPSAVLGTDLVLLRLREDGSVYEEIPLTMLEGRADGQPLYANTRAMVLGERYISYTYTAYVTTASRTWYCLALRTQAEA